jgi:hypothetical protein
MTEMGGKLAMSGVHLSIKVQIWFSPLYCHNPAHAET